MVYTKFLNKMKRVLRRVTGSTLEFDLSPYQKILHQINTLQTEFETKSNSELRKVSLELRTQSRESADTDNLLVKAFALVREAVRRTLKIDPFDEQIIGGIVMYRGRLAEMQTGEGKTLTAVFPAYLNALSGRGVHILTFNDYLARRDAGWMGPVYRFLGLRVGFVQEGMSIKERQIAYHSDITYLTAKEAGFDFLRDSLCFNQENIVHRELNAAFIDEADSILIDEARVPLIIAGASDETISDPYHLAQIVRQLEREIDFQFDEYARNIHLTEKGLKRVESRLHCRNLYDKKNIGVLTRLNCAIHAQYLLHRDVDYILRNGAVELVDEFTGRVADKRRWPDGLHAAIEAKENIAIQTRGHILNSIPLQHFIQLYPKFSGMTATAQPAEDEFREFYDLHITVIPPNKPCLRLDYPDSIYPTKRTKNNALIDEIVHIHKTKRPILVGTRSVEESAALASKLKNQGVRCDVLNAKRDAFEASIIARAGKLGAVTISTNMAGRGVDIKLGGKDEFEKDQVITLGGLYVIGTNRHESRRIDRQLRGRAGRQGDPGSSRFFISLEDDFFIKYRLKELFPPHLILDKGNEKITHTIVKREVERLQKIIEGQNLEIKKTLVQYSWLIEQQRKIIYNRRQSQFNDGTVLDFYSSSAPNLFKKCLSRVLKEELVQACRTLSLYHLDRFWSNYLAEMADIREGIHLTRLGGQTPLLEFHKRAVEIFERRLQETDQERITSFKKIRLSDDRMEISETGIQSPSSTWTYLINDDPFESTMGGQLLGTIGLSIGAGIWGPLLALFSLYRRRQRRRRQT
jgi:preprotein translocase subunit SecA